MNSGNFGLEWSATGCNQTQLLRNRNKPARCMRRTTNWHISHATTTTDHRLRLTLASEVLAGHKDDGARVLDSPWQMLAGHDDDGPQVPDSPWHIILA